MAVTRSQTANSGGVEPVAHGQQLIPGIPNDVTLDHVTSKLPRRDFHALATVSRGWCHAIRSHEVHNARVRSHSTETFILVNYRKVIRSEGSIAMALYSMKDGSCCELPPIPSFDGGIPWYCRAVSLDGKIYVLGGMVDSTLDRVSSKVYVLDLAGGRYWKPCASMINRRQRFGCGVVDGKIYVFGGTGLEHICEAEVYDPLKNTWSPIMPLTSLQFEHGVPKLWEVLFDLDYCEQNGDVDDLFRFGSSLKNGDSLKETWRKVEITRRTTMFMAKGRFHSIGFRDIHAYDGEKNSRLLHSSCYAALGLDSVWVKPFRVLAMGDELLAIGYWFSFRGINPGSCLLRGRGFGKEKEIVWQKVQFSVPSADWLPFETSYFMYPIQL